MFMDWWIWNLQMQGTIDNNNNDERKNKQTKHFSQQKIKRKTWTQQPPLPLQLDKGMHAIDWLYPVESNDLDLMRKNKATNKNNEGTKGPKTSGNY